MAKTSVVTDAGMSIVTNRIAGAGTEPNYIAWGTGAGTADAADTALFAESADESRVTGTSSQQTTNVANDTYRVVGTLTVATNAKTITEVGLLDAATGGNLFIHSSFDGIALDVGESIQFTIDAVFDQA